MPHTRTRIKRTSSGHGQREPLIAVWAGIGINVISICLKILMTASMFFLWILFRAFKR